MNEEQVLISYAAYSLDKTEQFNSSSGGVFSLLARAVISAGGVVYGVTMSDDCYSAIFVRVNNEQSLSKLRGSKYVQAKMGKTYLSVKDDLNAREKVLFSGTPCQINALIQFLGNGKGASYVSEKYPNLFCVDIICHGVPSPALWRKYAYYIEHKSKMKLVEVNFRCKENGWKDFCFKQIGNSRKAMYVGKDRNSYMKFFLQNLALRPSCYNCKVKNEKYADITIGDFWGVENIVPEMFDENGVSLVLVRTEKGNELFQSVCECVNTQEVSYREAIKRNPYEYTSVDKNINRDAFFKDMQSKTYGQLEKIYANMSLKSRIKSSIKYVICKVNFNRGGDNKEHSYGQLYVFISE